MSDEWVTPAEAARRLRCSIKCVYRLKDRGTLQAYRRPGARLLFKSSDVEALVTPVVLCRPKHRAGQRLREIEEHKHAERQRLAAEALARAGQKS